MFGVAVNHFSKNDHPSSVVQSAKFALSLLLNCPEVSTVVLVDGSAQRDEELESYCDRLGVRYEHAGRVLPFADAYNLGIGLLEEEWVATMASDIYVYPDTFRRFQRFIESRPMEEIGCLIPYMSSSDLPVQESHRNADLRQCYVPVMTFNLNVFPKKVYDSIGGMAARYTGNFNDVDVTIRLKDLGKSIFLVDSYVLHYGRMTLQHGTDVDLSKDRAEFFSAYPHLKSEASVWSIRMDHFLRSPLLRMTHRLIAMSVVAKWLKERHRTRRLLFQWTWRMIPRLQKI